MAFLGRASARALTMVALLCWTGSSVAEAAEAGGSVAPAPGVNTAAVPAAGEGGASAAGMGGSQYGVSQYSVTRPASGAGRPVVSELNVPRSASPGRPPPV